MDAHITSGAGRAQLSAPAEAPAGTLVAGRTEADRRARPTRWRMPGGWPLLPVLIVQTLLTLRLVRADTAHQDEALYLWAGHLQWANWLHGTAIPPFPYYFSGAPVIYPPLGALADHVGGLAGARVLSLVFMLAATILLFSAARRRYGRRAAFFAAALFATLGPTLHLGAFATYKAMSLFLVALAAWCVLRAGDRGVLPGRMIAAGAALALASATAYSTVLFDVLVVVLAVLAAFPAPGGRVALRRAAILLATVIVLLGAGLLAGGSNYLNGFKVEHPGPGRAHQLAAGGAVQHLVLGGHPRHPGRGGRRDQRGAARGPGPDLAAGRAGRRCDPGAGRAGLAAHRRAAERARGRGGLVRGHRRRLRRGPVRRRRCPPGGSGC